MAYDIETENGVITAPVTMVNGRLAFSTKAPTKGAWLQVAAAVGLIDTEGNPLGVDICHVGPVTLTWTTDVEGNRVPDTVDTSHHVNVLLSTQATQRGLWRTWVTTWLEQGSSHPPNASENLVEFGGITLIDNIKSPSNRIG